MKKVLFLLLTTLYHFAFTQTNKTYLFVGTYTDNKPDKGIYVYEFNPETGQLSLASTGENITNPSFLTISHDGKYVYACTDTKIPNAGSVTSFKVDSIKGALSILNKQPSGGENPVYVSASKNGRFVVNGNYTGGSAAVFIVNADGSLKPHAQRFQFTGKSINTARQEKSHVHSTVFSPDFNYVYMPDLGMDKIHVFRFDDKNSKPLKAIEQYDISTLPGSGPRHLTFHPNNKFAYCIEELSGMVSVYQYNNGKLDSIQRIFAYSKNLAEYSSADVHISPDGLFLYASNRRENENTIAIFCIEQETGKLTLAGHQETFGDHPRNFTIDPSGNFLLVANQFSNNVVVFKRDKKTGLLTKTGEEVTVPSPSCLQMRKYGR
jgi:6-phosphogluconolactonase